MFRCCPFRSASAVSFALLLLHAPSHAAVVYVNRSASGAIHNGKSWETAALTVQAGITAARSGDEVWVAAAPPPGDSYDENIVLPPGVALYGGFTGAETQRRERDWKGNPTILDGKRAGPVVMVGGAAAGTATVDGFTVRNAMNPTPAVYGIGGIYVSSGNAIISNNIIRRNADSGVYVDYGTATLLGNTISGNSGYGVGITYHGVATVSNNIISDNGGDGVYVLGTATLANNTVCGNGMAGIHLYSGTATVTNNTVCGNGNFGLQVYGAARVANTLVTHNGGYGVYKGTGGSFPAFSHNDVFGNVTADYSGFTPAANAANISLDPMLTNAFHDVHLQPGSPCIDGGDDTALIGTIDIDGEERIQGAQVDIGSDESSGAAWVVPARAWRVAPTGSDDSDGLTWVTAKKTLGATLSVARGGDEVWVAKGTYAEQVSPPAGVALYGGFAGTESVRSGRNAAANPTIIDGGGASGDAVYCRFLDIAVDGFAIRNAYNGVSVWSGTAALSGNSISANSRRGVIVYSSGTASLTRNGIRSNGADGVFVNQTGSASLTGNIVCDNAGSGLRVYSGTASLTNDTLCTNGGDGLYAYNSAPQVVNTIIAFNGGYGIYRDTNATIPVFSHNATFGNTKGDYAGFTPPVKQGNIALDPLFADRAAFDYHLQAGSPCAETGVDSVAAPGDTDLDGNPRKLGAHVDMGAYEFPVPGYFTAADAALALRGTGGQEALDAPGVARMDVAVDEPPLGVVNLADAVRIARKAAGLDTNP